MEALIAPALAAGGTATGGALLAKAAGPILGGIGAYSEAQGVKQQAEINSFIGRTRAIQTDEAARSGLESELAAMRNTFAANGQTPGVGTFEIMKELRKTRGQERRIAFGNRMQEAADYRLAAKNAGSEGKFALLGGIAKAGPSLFDFYDYARRV